MSCFRSLCCCFGVPNNSLTASRSQTTQAGDTEGRYNSFADNNYIYPIPRGPAVSFSINPNNGSLTLSTVFATFKGSRIVQVHECRDLKSSRGAFLGNFSKVDLTSQQTFINYSLDTALSEYQEGSLTLLYTEQRGKSKPCIGAELALQKKSSRSSSTTLFFSKAYQSNTEADKYVLFFSKKDGTSNSVYALTTNDSSQSF